MSSPERTGAAPSPSPADEWGGCSIMLEIQRVKANGCFAAKAEVAIPHRPGPGSVAAFDRTVQIASALVHY